MHYDLRRRSWKPKIGEWVWRREHPLSKKTDNFNAKLALKFNGTHEVRRIISPVIVDLRSKCGKWLRHIHIEHLKPANKEIDEENKTGDVNITNVNAEEDND